MMMMINVDATHLSSTYWNWIEGLFAGDPAAPPQCEQNLKVFFKGEGSVWIGPLVPYIVGDI